MTNLSELNFYTYYNFDTNQDGEIVNSSYYGHHETLPECGLVQQGDKLVVKDKELFAGILRSCGYIEGDLDESEHPDVEFEDWIETAEAGVEYYINRIAVGDAVVELSFDKNGRLYGESVLGVPAVGTKPKRVG